MPASPPLPEVPGKIAVAWIQLGAAPMTAIPEPAGNVHQDGGGGSCDLGLYPEKDLGLFVGGGGGKSRYLNGASVISYGGYAGASYWVTPGARLSASYNLSFNKVPVQTMSEGVIGYDQVEHALSLAGSWRF